MKDFHVSVVGGGIGGLCMAIGFLKGGVPVDIFESAPKFQEIGAGISIGLNAQHALQDLGLFETFQKKATTIPSGIWFQFRTGEGNDQRLICEVSTEHGNSSLHRAEFLDAMVKHVPRSIAHFGKRLKSVDPHFDAFGNGKRKVRLFFEDGSTHDTDLVIGCDGIHSVVRGFLSQNKAGASAIGGKDALVWSGSWAYRGLIPRERFEAAVGKNGSLYSLTPQMYLAIDKHILTFPIQNNETINVVAFTTDRSRWPERAKMKEGEPWVQQIDKDQMLHDFEGFGEDIINILRCIDKPAKWALHQLIPPLDTYVGDRVIVAGDAAHGGTPHQGAMAGQAIEDALFLSRLLSHPGVNLSNLDSVIPVVDAVRLPRANNVLGTSLDAGDVYEFRGPPGADLDKLAQDLGVRFEWIWNYDHSQEMVEAEKWLAAKGVQLNGGRQNGEVQSN